MGRVWLAAAALSVVTGCQPLPQPFAHNGSIDNGLLELPDHSGIVVLPVSDAPEPTATALAEAVAASLREANVPASTSGGNKLSAFLQGRVEDDGPSARIVWELFNPQGKVIGGRIQPIDGTPIGAWQSADAALMSKLGDRVGQEVAGLLQAEVPEEQIGRRVSVSGVEGAPGDGDRSLESAMRQALATAGVDVMAETDGVSRVWGEISLVPAGFGQEEVRITWVVVDSGGREVGVVAQANVVPTGSLDGAWDGVAQIVAEAAVPGILELLDKPTTTPEGRFTDADPLAKPQRPE